MKVEDSHPICLPKNEQSQRHYTVGVGKRVGYTIDIITLLLYLWATLRPTQIRGSLFFLRSMSLI